MATVVRESAAAASGWAGARRAGVVLLLWRGRGRGRGPEPAALGRTGIAAGDGWSFHL